MISIAVKRGKKQNRTDLKQKWIEKTNEQCENGENRREINGKKAAQEAAVKGYVFLDGNGRRRERARCRLLISQLLHGVRIAFLLRTVLFHRRNGSSDFLNNWAANWARKLAQKG